MVSVRDRRWGIQQQFISGFWTFCGGDFYRCCSSCWAECQSTCCGWWQRRILPAGRSAPETCEYLDQNCSTTQADCLCSITDLYIKVAVVASDENDGFGDVRIKRRRQWRRRVDRCAAVEWTWHHQNSLSHREWTCHMMSCLLTFTSVPILPWGRPWGLDFQTRLVGLQTAWRSYCCNAAVTTNTQMNTFEYLPVECETKPPPSLTA